MAERLKSFFLFILLFMGLSVPGLMTRSSYEKVPVRLKEPKQEARRIASVAKPAQKHCEPAKRWRYKCENKENCEKDRQEVYLKCQSL